MVVRLTDQRLKSLRADERRLEVRDSEVTGLLIRVTPTGEKLVDVGTALAVVSGSRRSNLSRHFLAKARKKAQRVLASVADGHNPAAERAAERVADTFKDLAMLYLERRAAGKRSRPEQERIINAELLPAWSNRKVADITRRDVQQLVDRIASRPAPVMANRVFLVDSVDFQLCHRPRTDRSKSVRAHRTTGRSGESRVIACWQTTRLGGSGRRLMPSGRRPPSRSLGFNC